MSKPQQFDVIVTPNLYGNIASNIGAGLVGGPGLIPGYNLSSNYAIFEPGSRHVAKDLQGMNAANPMSMILCSTLLLNHLGLTSYADVIYRAVLNVIADGKVNLRDII